jgi:plastocyanin
VRSIVAVAALALLLGAPAAFAALPPPVLGDALVVSGPGAWLTTFTTPLVLVKQGQPLTYLNLDPRIHDVVALDAEGPEAQPWCRDFVTPTGGCALFWSARIFLAESTPVLGLENAAPGTYRFYCTLHRNMQGDLLLQA